MESIIRVLSAVWNAVTSAYLWVRTPIAKFLLSKGVKRETFRATAFMVIASLALIPMWQESQVVLYMIGVVAMACYATHLFLKIIFPYMDTQEFLELAKATPLSAALVILARVLVMCVIIHSIIQLVSPAAR